MDALLKHNLFRANLSLQSSLETLIKRRRAHQVDLETLNYQFKITKISVKKLDFESQALMSETSRVLEQMLFLAKEPAKTQHPRSSSNTKAPREIAMSVMG